MPFIKGSKGSKKLTEMSPYEAAQVRARMSEALRQAWKERNQNKLGTRVNGVFQEEVKEQISNQVRKRWEEGSYKDRLNGMTNKTGARHHNWTWGKEKFREILLQHEEPICAYCGTKEGILNVHHIDENHDNYLLSNLQWACVPCHLHINHYQNKGDRLKFPFVTLTKKFPFEYAHILPWHPGKCSQLHGHSGHLEVEVKGRINIFGIVQDFFDISSIVKMAVVEVFDHQFLNDFIDNPTTENLLVDIWLRLEKAGLKGLRRITFSETDSSCASIDVESMVEAFGWDFNNQWELVSKVDFNTRILRLKWSMAHALVNSEGTEKRIHGHDWEAFLICEEDISISKVQKWVDENLNCKCLVNYNHLILKPYTEGEGQFSKDIVDLGIVPVDFEPTADNIAKLIYKKALSILEIPSNKLKVEVIETSYMEKGICKEE